MKKNSLKSLLIIVIIVCFFSLAAFGLSFYTNPLIEKHNQASSLGPLKEVMKDAVGFECIYDSSDKESSALKNVDDRVTKIYKETTDKGYVFKCSTTSKYSKAPLIFTVGVASDGKISGVKVDEYHDSVSFEDYPNSFVGKDSTLENVGVHAGATFSSNAFKEALLAGFNALIENDLIKAGVKGDDQILTELIATVHTGLVSNGVLKATDIAAYGKIIKGYEATNGSGNGFIMKDNDKMYLAVTNTLGCARIYDVDGNDVTSEHEDLKTLALSKTTLNSYDTDLENKVSVMMKGATEFTPLQIDVYNNVVSALKFNVDGKVYYAFYAKTYGFQLMDLYLIIDEAGAIAKLDAKEFVFETQYFPGFDSDAWSKNEGNYRDSFIGLTDETFDGSNALIASATLSSNAIKEATNDSFAAFNAMMKGENK